MIIANDTAESFIKNYREKLPFSYFVKDILPHPATFIKSSLFNQVSLYDEDLKIVSDWKFFVLVVVKHNYSYRKVQEVLFKF